MPLFVHLPWQRAEPVCFEMMASPYCDVPCGEVCLTRTAWRPGYVHIRRKSLVDGCCRDTGVPEGSVLRSPPTAFWGAIGVACLYVLPGVRSTSVKECLQPW